MNIGIVGAGIMGRTLAYFLSKNKFKVSIFEKNSFRHPSNCSYIAAGMLTPFSELSYQLPSIVNLGISAINIWQAEIASMKSKTFFKKNGTLFVAFEENYNQLQFFEKKLIKMNLTKHFRRVKSQEIENEIDSRIGEGIYLPCEAQLSAKMLMNALAVEIDKRNVSVFEKNLVSKIENKIIFSNDKKYKFDYIIDCRGLNAKKELKNLRGVRGEMILLQASSVKLEHMVRIFNMEYPIYVIPRPNNHFLIGASCIDSEDSTPISLITALELLTHIYCLHRGFSEARIIKMITHCRPAFETNMPKIILNDYEKIIHINGLYRHGYLFAPIFANAVIKFFHNKCWEKIVSNFIFEMNDD